jgi:hypothetical protein
VKPEDFVTMQLMAAKGIADLMDLQKRVLEAAR